MSVKYHGPHIGIIVRHIRIPMNQSGSHGMSCQGSTLPLCSWLKANMFFGSSDTGPCPCSVENTLSSEETGGPLLFFEVCLYLLHSLVNQHVVMENPPFWWYLPGKMGIFHGDVLVYRRVEGFFANFTKLLGMVHADVSCRKHVKFIFLSQYCWWLKSCTSW